MSKKPKKSNEQLQEEDYEEFDLLGYGMDKDDALDFLLTYQMVDRWKKGKFAFIKIGADDPDDLLEKEVEEFARQKAEFLLHTPMKLIGEFVIDINRGQSFLSTKEFYFAKG